MKRTGFTRPSYAEVLEKKKIKDKAVKKVIKKKVKKITTSQLQKKVWEECRRIARLRYKNDCYTCGKKNLQGSDCQLGHMWPKSVLGANLKYDLRVLRWQCTNCNIWGGGMGADYYARMLQEIGEENMRRLYEERQISVKAYDFYVQLLITYKDILQ